MYFLQNFENRKVLLSLSLIGIFLASGLSLLGSQAYSPPVFNAPERITAHPNPASPGSTVKVVGYNFPISQTITVKIDSTIVGATKAGPTGEFSFLYTLPISFTDGSHMIYATDSFGDFLFTTLTVAAGITLSPVRAIDGGSVTVSGAGFSHSSVVMVSFDGKKIYQTTTSSTGTFAFTYQVPMTTLAGVHTFLAKDIAHSTSQTFTTISKITLSRTTGTVGQTVKVKGTGFAANSPLTLTFNGAPIPGQPAISTNSTGGFSPSFSVPSQPAGTYTVKATDSRGDTSSSHFTVMP